MDENDHTNETTHAPPKRGMPPSDFSAPTLDVNRYLPLASDLGIDEEAKREFLQTLWNILVTVVELDLNIDPIQMLFSENTEIPSETGSDDVEFPSEPTRKSIDVAAAFKGQNVVLEES